MTARDVDAFLTGLGGTQLPVSGGIVKKLPYEMIEKMEQQAALQPVAA
jgi:glutamate synthase (NADPH/NADH)